MGGPLVALRNARVLTMDLGIPHASVVHVRDGRIVEVGDAATRVRARARGTSGCASGW